METRSELKWVIQRLKNIWHLFRSLFWIAYYGYPARKMTVIGITGTDGKTTTATIVYEILKAAGFRSGLITTLGAKYANNKNEEIELETGLHVTTPAAKEIQRIIRQMVNDGVTHLIIEATAHGLDQHRLLGTNIKIGVLTNLSHEHLDDFVTMERYARAKLKLFKGTRYAVLNQDDEYFSLFRSTIINAGDTKIISYERANISDDDISKFLRGEYNRYNIAAAQAIARIMNIDDAVTYKILKEFKGIRGRLEEIREEGLRIFVDFAHTPNGLRNVLTLLKRETAGRLIVVFGCTGERDRTKRPIMGKIASAIADIVIVTSDDTRNESQDEIASQIISGIDDKNEKMKAGALIIENDRRIAIRKALEMAKTDDIVLVAGKGHEKSINLGGREYPWSDAEIVREEMKEIQKQLTP